MSKEVSYPESPIVIIGLNENKEKTFNNEKYSSLLRKKLKIESKYNSLSLEKPNDILSYSTFFPLIITLNSKSQYKITKEKLNKIFVESSQKKFHKEIYNSKLFELINPYYLVSEKKYINEKYISNAIKSKFNEEKEEILEREYALSPNEFYDKNNQIYFGFVSQRNKMNKIRNNTLIKKAIIEKNILVRIKNEIDCFDKNFLLNSDFKIKELKSLIAFIYKTVLSVKNPGNITLFYYTESFKEIYLNDDNKTLKDIGKEMNKKNVLDIFINADY